MADCNDCIEETNTPSVDNTSLECEELHSDICVVVKEAYPYIGTSSGDALTRVLTKIVDKIKAQDSRMDSLEARIEALEP